MEEPHPSRRLKLGHALILELERIHYNFNNIFNNVFNNT